MAKPLATTSTGVATTEAKGEWVIEEYSFLKAKIQTTRNSKDLLSVCIQSDTLLSLGDIRLNLRVYPFEGDDQPLFGVYLARSVVDRNVFVKLSLTLVNQLGKGDESRHVTADSLKKDEMMGWAFVLSANVDDEKSGFKLNDRVVIRYEIKASLGEVSFDTVIPPSLKNTLSNDLEELLRSKEGSDVTLHCGETLIPCHSLILGSRSKVFKKMFQAGMKEMVSREVHIEDMESEEVQAFVHYLYTNELKTETVEDDDMLCHLLQAAHKYEVTSLAEYCADMVGKTLAVENVAERLFVADMYDCAALRASCLRFMTKSPSVLAEVQSTAGFAHLSSTRPSLLKHILATISKPAPARKRQSPSDFEFPEGSDWARLSIASLRRACKERGLLESGTKATLKQRLQTMETSSAAF